ncbi:SGNH/GDSL hydrolase family protein [Hankyongella ginsenosidimutans]|uniref:SGNH/GDSL hydrolase family protein n=1 Tax=Hankyongella ginsenosidimutans TaxID=1763828 RepID=UPI001CA3040B|nr:SGNH/GDSL hydrolase family protein [Hankyongella ginsenosidimutans]
MKKVSAALLAATVLAAIGAAVTAKAATVSGLYVFGDSLVDAGNTQALVLSVGGSDPTPASVGYFNGHFTNGYDYTDLLSIRLTGAPTVAALQGGANFAFGGARTRDNGDFLPTWSRRSTATCFLPAASRTRTAFMSSPSVATICSTSATAYWASMTSRPR